MFNLTIRSLGRSSLTLSKNSSINRVPYLSFSVASKFNAESRDKFGNLYEVPEYPFPSLAKNVSRPNETAETLRSRLVYQCRKRGILETDLILSTFAKEHLSKLSHEDCKDLDRLLEENDWDIYYWATEERVPPPKIADLNVFKLLRDHAKNKAKRVLRMPDL
ncbi:Succinate dehydrogenase assembly factor 2 mitochondrial [Entomophthora muscae]|uniref:Succinate dehydrogenase assembly factor 2 mitochondrial n=1 Tax=Entomophthora muscae TaxID=34485 RepID=A0ACC2URM9_9FUNG|nr:Succinate dehydrogenase assembly factor 2 mitochondrial [Entomophthora muscae]